MSRPALSHHPPENIRRPLPKRLDSLTSLRFFAAFAVFAHHFTGFGGLTGMGRAPLIYPYSQIGAYGVDFFFVLSGFLLTWIYKPGEHLGSYYWRRFGRIFPATLAALPLAIFADYYLSGVRINWFGLISSVLLIQTWFPHIQPELPGNGVTWTLSVELLFYALFPLAVGWILRMRSRWLVPLTAASLLAMYAVCWWSAANFSQSIAGWVMRTPLVYLPVFLTGMTTAVLLKRGWRLRMHPALPVLLVLGYTVAYYQGRAHLSASLVAQLDYLVRPVVTVLSALVVTAFVERELLGRKGLLNRRLLVNLGVWSYSFYLLHQSVTRILEWLIGRLPDANVTLIALLLVGVLANLLSWAMFRWVEEPAERWWRARVPERWRRQPEFVAQPAPVQAPIG
ncbi:acyltransferase family protein [Phaeacidiphilus oryzae]|uniref:acyltransferase family protein n=1 Tax=Phaeacidiphilus oryzae TaxID=348818 RepID=UPI00068E84E6|nr:acyltransferase [Phaeacidiphilus oryzae]